MSAVAVEEVDVAIIGAGFAGLGTGIQLARRGRESFVILERGDDVGGTWRDNRYPGVACDIPSHLYCFSFRPNPDWSALYAPGEEIQAYLRDCAREEGLEPHIRLRAEVRAARWEADAWTVESDAGDYRARVLVVATGRLSEPRIPALGGMLEFGGAIFHSARWDDTVELAGKRVGVAGSGATAAQVVPAVAEVAESVVVFQRSAPYVVPARQSRLQPGRAGRLRSGQRRTGRVARAPIPRGRSRAGGPPAPPTGPGHSARPGHRAPQRSGAGSGAAPASDPDL